MHKKILSGWGSATNAAGGAYDALPDLLVGRAGNTSPQNLVGDYGACILVPLALITCFAVPTYRLGITVGFMCSRYWTLLALMRFSVE